MAFARTPIALIVTALALAACGGLDDAAPPQPTRALLPPVEDARPALPSTTTTPPVNSIEADLLAQTQVRTILAIADELFAERGTYDTDLEELAAMTAGVPVVSLEEAALRDGVVYDAHGPRLTLHRRSAGGDWFCIDISDRGNDFGTGESFEAALAACTDGVRAAGWGDVFSPTGPDEASIQAILGALVDALASGDTVAAYDTFGVQSACSTQDLQAIWPGGVVLVADDEYQLQSLTVTGDNATAAIVLGPLSDSAWPLHNDQRGWRHAADPCELLGPVAAELLDPAGRDLLEEALFVVRSAFVMETDFAFTNDAVADLDPNLEWVPAAEVAFGTLSYTGHPDQGLVLTAGAPGHFYCAVESLSAMTVYGAGTTIDDVNTVGRCRANAEH